jgi:hypothetical protein
MVGMNESVKDNLKVLKDYFGDGALSRRIYSLIGNSPISMVEQYGGVIVQVDNGVSEIIVTPTIDESEPYIVPKTDRKGDSRRHYFYDPSIA